MDLNSTLSCTSPETIFNLTNPDKAYHFLYGTVDTIIITVIIPIISVVGIVGNGAFIYMSYRVPELRSATVTSYLVHLAVCDIMFLLFINGWYAVTLTSSPVNSSYPVNSTFGCAVWTITTHWWYLASLGLITLISVERYLAICQPVTHRNIRGKARTMKLIVATWVCSLALTLTLVPRYGRFITNCMLWPETEDFVNLPDMVNDCEPISLSADVYASFMEIITLLLTMIINIVLFVRIIQALRRISGSSSSSDYTDRVRYQVTRTLVANGILFFVCQVPYRVFTVDDVFDNLGGFDILQSQKLESLVLTVGRAFVFLNSIINPYLYVFSCQHYRKGMLKAFCGDRCAKTGQYDRATQYDKRISTLTETSITPV